MKNRNLKFTNDIREKGFTLPEIVYAMAIFAALGTVVLNIITSTLRGSKKTNITSNVRQNGNFAISQMSKMIGYAKRLEGASLDGNPPWDCQVMPPPPAPPPPSLHYKSIKIISFDEGATIFSCNDSGDTPPNTIASNSASLIDENPTTGSVALSTPIPNFCFFTCRKERIFDSPTIGIKFTLTSKGTSSLPESKISIPFETSIKMRNAVF